MTWWRVALPKGAKVAEVVRNGQLRPDVPVTGPPPPEHLIPRIGVPCISWCEEIVASGNPGEIACRLETLSDDHGGDKPIENAPIITGLTPIVDFDFIDPVSARRMGATLVGLIATLDKPMFDDEPDMSAFRSPDAPPSNGMGGVQGYGGTPAFDHAPFTARRNSTMTPQQRLRQEIDALTLELRGNNPAVGAIEFVRRHVEGGDRLDEIECSRRAAPLLRAAGFVSDAPVRVSATSVHRPAVDGRGVGIAATAPNGFVGSESKTVLDLRGVRGLRGVNTRLAKVAAWLVARKPELQDDGGNEFFEEALVLARETLNGGAEVIE